VSSYDLNTFSQSESNFEESRNDTNGCRAFSEALVTPVPPHWIPLCPIVGRQHTSPAATTSTAPMAQEGTSAWGGGGGLESGTANFVLLACGLGCLNPPPPPTHTPAACTLMNHLWMVVIALRHLNTGAHTHTHTHTHTFVNGHNKPSSALDLAAPLRVSML